MTGARLAIVMVVALSASLHAQWLNYPTPRRASHTGWQARPVCTCSARGRRQAGSVGNLATRAATVRTARECQTDYVPAAEFINFGAKLPGGLPYQPWAASARQGTHRATGEGRSCRLMPARRRAADSDVPTVQKIPPDARAVRDSVRTRRDVSADFHGRSATARTIRRRRSTATRSDDGMATRWS